MTTRKFARPARHQTCMIYTIVPRAPDQTCAIIRARIGLRTNKANATTSMFMMAVNKNTICQLPVETLIMLATGTRNADVPLAV